MDYFLIFSFDIVYLKPPKGNAYLIKSNIYAIRKITFSYFSFDTAE